MSGGTNSAFKLVQRDRSAANQQNQNSASASASAQPNVVKTTSLGSEFVQNMFLSQIRNQQKIGLTEMFKVGVGSKPAEPPHLATIPNGVVSDLEAAAGRVATPDKAENLALKNVN